MSIRPLPRHSYVGGEPRGSDTASATGCVGRDLDGATEGVRAPSALRAGKRPLVASRTDLTFPRAYSWHAKFVDFSRKARYPPETGAVYIPT